MYHHPELLAHLAQDRRAELLRAAGRPGPSLLLRLRALRRRRRRRDEDPYVLAA
ncbi:MAG: hypothetical protein R2755_05070 [Acidimicrobiales bacterium]